MCSSLTTLAPSPTVSTTTSMFMGSCIGDLPESSSSSRSKFSSGSGRKRTSPLTSLSYKDKEHLVSIFDAKFEGGGVEKGTFCIVGLVRNDADNFATVPIDSLRCPLLDGYRTTFL